MAHHRRRVLIMGAAGRDFHNFNAYYRDNNHFEVVAFTAFQIPNIEGRVYPPELAGKLYPKGISIYAESELSKLIREYRIDEVVFSYSDVAYEDVMRKGALVNASGADFTLLGPRTTMLHSRRPVVSVCAVRTGCGKSQTSRAVATLLKELGQRTAAVRHPMPYGDLKAQRCQRFEKLEDLDKHHCTIEEREEYEAHIELKHVVYAGVDYAEILKAAESEADVVLWDGGNNDFPFYKSDLHIVLVDPHRPGHEISYYPGQVNLLSADVILIAKSGTAKPEGIEHVKKNIALYNPRAKVLQADSVVRVEQPESIRGKRVLVIEDGPTLTHGEMSYGAGIVAARNHGASEIVDPRRYAVGSIAQTYQKYTHLKDVLPAMGYGEKQLEELIATIRATPCDAVLVGTPFDLKRLIGDVGKKMLRVTYELDGGTVNELRGILKQFLKGVGHD